MYENLNVYRGCTFDCSISLVDRKQDPYFLAEGDKLIFGVKDSLKVEPGSNKEPEDIIHKELTIDDAIAGKYYFRLSPDETSKPTQRYFYYVAIELADGDRYQIAPYSEFNVKMPIAIPHGACYEPHIKKYSRFRSFNGLSSAAFRAGKASAQGADHHDRRHARRCLRQHPHAQS